MSIRPSVGCLPACLCACVCVCLRLRLCLCLDFFTIVQLEQGDQASSDWPDPTKLGHWKGSGLRTLSHVPASFWIASFGTIAHAVKYRLVRFSGSIYVMFDHDWHTLTWRHLGIRRPEVLLSSSTKNQNSVCMSMHIYVCLCMSMYAYVCLCISMYVYAYQCMSMYVYVCLCILCMPMYVYAYLCMSMYVYVYVCLCMSL